MTITGNGCSAWSSPLFFTGYPSSGGAEVVEAAEYRQTVAAGATEVFKSAKVVGKTDKKIDADKIRTDGAWYLRIIARADDKIDRGTVLGQLPNSVDGRDEHDLEKRLPFGNSFLSVMFPHDEWTGDEWGFASDYRKLKHKPSGTWLFAVYVSKDVADVTLSFEGPPDVLKKIKLRHQGVKGKAASRKGEAYTFTPEPGYNYFTLNLEEALSHQ